MKIEIVNRFSGEVIYSHDADENSIAITLTKAVKEGANLDGANLYGANLTRANLDGANLYGAKIDGEKITIQPLMVSGLLWYVLISDGYMRIGCQRHKHSEWAEFTEPQISEMESRALEFWKVWKSPLMAICEQHAAKAEAAKAAKE